MARSIPARHRMADPRRPWQRRRPVLLLTGLAVLVGTLGARVSADAAVLLSADFEHGSLSEWSKSGGSWSIVTDGTRVLRQSHADSENARLFAGSGWGDFQVSAQVQPNSATQPRSGVGLLARATSNTSFDRLTLLPGGVVQLQAVNSGAVTILATGVAVPTLWVTLRIVESGPTVTGYVGGALVGSGPSHARSGRIGLQTNFATASFDDVLVESAPGSPTPTGASPTPSASTPPPTPPPTAPTSPPPSTPTQPAAPVAAEEADGFAGLNGGTTGGAGGPTVTVTSLPALQTETARGAPEMIRLDADLNCAGAEVTVASDKTLLGVGASPGLTGCGLKINDVHNVIVRNLRIAKVTADSGTGDAIHVEASTNIWIDHNDLSTDQAHGKDFYDGLIDITHAADFITVSWNRLHDHFKASLVGHSDGNDAEDTGHLRVTYHHNWFETINSRTPSLRFGTGHVYNNYFLDGDSGVHSRMGAQMLVQNNVFAGVGEPVTTTGDSDEDGFVNESGNDFGGGTNRITQVGTLTDPGYPFTLDATSSVVAEVTAGAGTGTIG